MVSKAAVTKVRMFIWKLTHYKQYKKFKSMLKQDLISANIRPGMKFGYYGCFYDQVNETKDHTNLLWEIRQKPLEQVIANIRNANTDTVLDIGAELWQTGPDGKVSFRDDAEVKLRGLLSTLRKEGILHLVKVLYPHDEPNLPRYGITEKDLRQAINITRKVASEFYELMGVKLGVIYYGGDYPYPCIDLFDIVGMDWYERSPEYLFLPKEGIYEKYILSKLQPGQQVWVVPGGYLKQDPKPFVNWANSKSVVYGIIPFIWNHPRYDGTMNSADFSTDIHTNGMANIYRQAGLIVTGRV